MATHDRVGRPPRSAVGRARTVGRRLSGGEPERSDLGIALPTHRLLDVAGLALGAYLIMFAARVLPVYGLLGLTDPSGSSIPWRWRHMTVWGGLRGALSVALALSVAAYPGVNPNVSVIAYGMVVLSLIVQGGLLLPVADLLRLRSRTVV